MASPDPPLPPGLENDPRFTTTRWSLILAAGGADSREVGPALRQLIERYWYPLYAFVRRKGHDPEESCDLTQEFLSRLLEKNLLRAADPRKGRFRTFLLTALSRFLVDEWRREGRQVRGGDRAIVSLDFLQAEARYRLEPADTLTPERIYERRWAMTLLERTLKRLGEECASAGRQEFFTAVEPALSGGDPGEPYAQVAERLGMSEGALKTAVHRLRRRFAAILRAEIAETVGDPREVDDEVRHLFQSLK